MTTRTAKRHKQPRDEKPNTIELYYLPAFFCSFDPAPKDSSDINPTIKIWIRHPAELEFNYDATRAYSINLNETPRKYNNSNFRHLPDRLVDDHMHNNGYTTIGPCFPQAYGAGGVYVSDVARDEAIAKDSGTRRKGKKRLQGNDALADEVLIVQAAPDQADPLRYHGFFGQQLADPDSVYRNLWVVWHPGTWISRYIPYMNGRQWRSPRKLWIPDNAMFAVQDSRSIDRTDDNVDPTQGIHIEQDYATYVANLDVPKMPSGSGEAAIALGAVDRKLKASGAGLSAFEPNLNVTMRRLRVSRTAPRAEIRNLSVVSEYTPGEMCHIRAKITSDWVVVVCEGETLVEALSEFLQDLKACYARENSPIPAFDNLDIIGHSRSRDRILKIGELPVTSRVARSQFSQLDDRGILADLGIKSIRLLGCRTASHPRGRHVVQTIRDCTTDVKVFATRTDLFAVHYDERGFLKDAEILLADDEVILGSGPGDLPPQDDYPADPPDDDDDDDDEDPVTPNMMPPGPFSLSALSNVNASAISSDNYFFWEWEPEQINKLARLLYTDWWENDNPLWRADYEVLISTTTEPHDTDDFRSFDLFLTGARPRLRVHKRGVSYAFFFQCPQTVYDDLCGIGINVVPPKA